MTDDSPFDPFDEEVRQNLEHLAMLRRDPEVWSKWRAKNQHIKIVLKGANLSNADLRHVDLTYANLEGADLTQADLSGAKLAESLI